MPASTTLSPSSPASEARPLHRRRVELASSKDWDACDVRVALAYPDLYDIGMSNLGLGILYDIVNRREGMLAERVFAPWSDLEAIMRAEGDPALEPRDAPPAARVRRHRLLAQLRGHVHQHPQHARPGGPARAAPRSAPTRTRWSSAAAPARSTRTRSPTSSTSSCWATAKRRSSTSSTSCASGSARAAARATRCCSGSRRSGASTSRASTSPSTTPTARSRRSTPSSTGCRARVTKRFVQELPPALTTPDRPVPADRARPRGHRDPARLHAGLPLLPGRHHLPPAARALARRRCCEAAKDARAQHRATTSCRWSRSARPTTRASCRSSTALRDEFGEHADDLAAVDARRQLLGAHRRGRRDARQAQHHLRAGGRHGAPAHDDQQDRHRRRPLRGRGERLRDRAGRT